MSARPTPIRVSATVTPGMTLYVVTPDELRQMAFDAAREALASVQAATPAILPDRPLNQGELARLLACSPEHVRHLEQRGEIVSETAGRQRLYSPETIARLLQRRLDGQR